MAKKCWDDIPILPGADSPECASAAARAEEAAKNACICAQRAEDADLHSPIIQDGYWYVYDASIEEYVPTEVSASGIDQYARDQISDIQGGLTYDMYVLVPHSDGQNKTFSTVLIYADGKYILIDFGSASSAPSAITQIKQITSHIDVAIITHYHTDHVGGLNAFMSEIDFTGCVFYLPPYVDFSALGATSSDRNLDVVVMNTKAAIIAADATYEEISTATRSKQFGSFDIHFYNIEPEKYNVYYSTVDSEGNAIYNNFSMVCTVSMYNACLLNTGDITLAAETQLTGEITEKADILMVPHHGWLDDATGGHYSEFYEALGTVRYCVCQNYSNSLPIAFSVLHRTGAVCFTTSQSGSARFDFNNDECSLITDTPIQYVGNFAGYIASNSDLNDFKSVGTYYASSASIAQTLTNCPLRSGFEMRVEYAESAGTIRQSLRSFNYSDLKYYDRLYQVSSGLWSDWYPVVDTSLDNPINIANNTDLDTLTDVGFYLCSSSTKAQTLSNCPTTLAFSMTVEYATTENNRRQIIKNYASTRFDMYTRSLPAGGSWTDWYVISGTPVT